MSDPAEKITEPYSGANSNSSQSLPIDSAKIISKAKAILSDPKNVWTGLKNEQVSIKALFQGYFLPLAAIGALCGFLGMWLFGFSIAGITVRAPFFGGLIGAVLKCAMTLIGIGVGGFIVHQLAGRFGGNATLEHGIKLIGYGSTAALLANFLSIIPALGIIGFLLGLYSIYTIYQGIPVMTGVPIEKRLIFFISTLVVSFIAFFIIATVTSVVSPWSPADAMSGGLTIETRDGKFDPTKLEQGLKEFEKLLPKAATGQ